MSAAGGSGRRRRGPRAGRRAGIPPALVVVLVAAGGVLFLALAIVYVLTPHGRQGPRPQSPFPPVVTPFKTDEHVGQKQPVEAGTHIATGTAGAWQTMPPSSGQHWPAPAPWGPAQQALPPERWVHNLEHGGIVVLFRDAADAPTAAAFARQAPAETQFGEVKVVDAPYPKLAQRFALVAWGWVDQMDAWSDTEALSFYAAHVDRGPEAVP